MSRLQVFSYYDPNRLYKESVVLRNPEISFFDHSHNGIDGEIEIGSGSFNGKSYTERVYTDGTLRLLDSEVGTHTIIWDNQSLTLKDGMKATFVIENASYLLNVLESKHYGDDEEAIYERRVDIHSLKETKEQLEKLVKLSVKDTQLLSGCFLYQDYAAAEENNSLTTHSYKNGVFGHKVKRI